MHLKILSAKCRPFCLGGDELTQYGLATYYLFVIAANVGLDNGLLHDDRHNLTQSYLNAYQI